MALVFGFRVENVARTIPKHERDRLIERLERIARDPYGQHPDAKRRTDGTYQVRHGGWRAVYRITPTHDVYVIRMAPRGRVNRP
jgi:mRNA-degrading endonuclease RelE of RelBE toxin-antitoxin system